MNEADVVAVIRTVFRAAGCVTEHDDDDTARIDDLLISHVTTDVSVEGVDFDRALYPLRFAGLRALAQNVSDLYASDAEPLALLQALSLPPSWTLDDVERFSRGTAQLAGALGMRLLGGDLSRTAGPMQCAITAFGRAPQLSTTRHGARAGQGLWVTRQLGGSAAGLRVLFRDRVGDDEGTFARWRRGLSSSEQRAVACHVEPQVVHGLERLTDFAVAAIDVSDGLAIDAGRLAQRSGLAVDLDNLDAAIDERAGATVDDVLRGGEDWAVLFAVPDGLDPIGCIRVGTFFDGAAGSVFVDG
ncbi:MAG TPA: thiamine-phosphate kinase, partial [Myxococcota bacterium]